MGRVPGWETLPENYSQMIRSAQQQINNVIENPGSLLEAEDAEAEHFDLQRLREVSSRVRANGYHAGQQDHYVVERESGVSIERGLLKNPYPEGTGARECWIRGYCQGRSVGKIVDPQVYLPKPDLP